MGIGGAAALTATYFIGTDISRVQTDAPGTMYTDNDGTQKPLLQLLKGHGFNFIRVRTSSIRGPPTEQQDAGFYDIPQPLLLASRSRSGNGFLLDFHYADNWSDPASSVCRSPGREPTTIGALAHACTTTRGTRSRSSSRRGRDPTWCRSATRSRRGC